MSLLDQAPLSPRHEAISLPPVLPLKKTIQRDMTYRPKPIPSDTAPCVLGNTAACILAVFGLPSFHTQTSRQKYVFMSHEILMDTSIIQALHKSLRLDLFWKLCHSSSWIKNTDKDRSLRKFSEWKCSHGNTDLLIYPPQDKRMGRMGKVEFQHRVCLVHSQAPHTSEVSDTDRVQTWRAVSCKPRQSPNYW